LKIQQRKKSQAWLPQAVRLQIEKERRLATDKGKKAMPVNVMTAGSSIKGCFSVCVLSMGTMPCALDHPIINAPLPLLRSLNLLGLVLLINPSRTFF